MQTKSQFLKELKTNNKGLYSILLHLKLWEEIKSQDAIIKSFIDKSYRAILNELGFFSKSLILRILEKRSIKTYIEYNSLRDISNNPDTLKMLISITDFPNDLIVNLALLPPGVRLHTSLIKELVETASSLKSGFQIINWLYHYGLDITDNNAKARIKNTSMLYRIKTAQRLKKVYTKWIEKHKKINKQDLVGVFYSLNFPRGITPLTNISQIIQEGISQKNYLREYPDCEYDKLMNKRSIYLKVIYPERATAEIGHLLFEDRWVLNNLSKKSYKELTNEKTEEYILNWIDSLNNFKDVSENWGAITTKYTLLTTNAQLRKSGYFEGCSYSNMYAKEDELVFKINDYQESFFTLKCLGTHFYDLIFISDTLPETKYTQIFKQIQKFVILSNLKAYQQLWGASPAKLPGFKDIYILGEFDIDRKPVPTIWNDSLSGGTLLLHTGDVKGLSYIYTSAINNGKDISIDDFIYSSEYRLLGNIIEDMGLGLINNITKGFKKRLTPVGDKILWYKICNAFSPSNPSQFFATEINESPILLDRFDLEKSFLSKNISHRYVLKTSTETCLLYKNDTQWVFGGLGGFFTVLDLDEPLCKSILNSDLLPEHIKVNILEGDDEDE